MLNSRLKMSSMPRPWYWPENKETLMLLKQLKKLLMLTWLPIRRDSPMNLTNSLEDRTKIDLSSSTTTLLLRPQELLESTNKDNTPTQDLRSPSPHEKEMKKNQL